MQRLSSVAVALLLMPVAAAAAPVFKPAPVAEKDPEEAGGFVEYLPIDTEAAPPWAQLALEFLDNYYGYIGVVAVLLMLFLFARGAGGNDEKTATSASDDDDDFFEPGDADSYRGGSRR